MTIEMELGDVVRLRKAHPCGTYEGEVVRVGSSIGPRRNASDASEGSFWPEMPSGED
jgi:hypothetical protein